MATLNTAYLVKRVQWSVCQLLRVAVRRLGVVRLVWATMVAVLLLMLVVLINQSQRIEQLKSPQAAPSMQKGAESTDVLGAVDELSAFERDLLDYGDIPDTLRDLIVLAQANHLVLSRGEYQAQINSRGQFLRYQMTLPVRGEAHAVERFILEALVKNKTLALDSVQFKREGRSSTDLEAKVQWVLLTRLPKDAGVPL